MTGPPLVEDARVSRRGLGGQAAVHSQTQPSAPAVRAGLRQRPLASFHGRYGKRALDIQSLGSGDSAAGDIRKGREVRRPHDKEVVYADRGTWG